MKKYYKVLIVVVTAAGLPAAVSYKPRHCDDEEDGEIATALLGSTTPRPQRLAMTAGATCSEVS